MTVLISIIVFVVAVNIIRKHTTVFFEEIIEITYLVSIISNLIAIFFKINTFTVNSCPTKYLASILAKISIFFRKVIACFMEFIYEHSTSIVIEEIVLSIKQKSFSFGLFSSWIKVVFLMINNLKSSG
ncbi:unknown [Streptococcus salivarius CAG:79]|nr:unknown [Streptococcus salivarius CAG:79]